MSGILPPLLPPVGTYTRQSVPLALGVAPNSVLGPNMVYHGGLCVAQTLSEPGGGHCSAEGAQNACALRSDVCLDAVTRGLLGGLQPLLQHGESVL